eukprot:464222_1
MANAYSKEWFLASIVAAGSLVSYSAIFRIIYQRSVSQLSPQESKIISSCIISTIHAIVCSLCGIIGVFYHKYWKTINEENEPGIPFYIFSQVAGYMIADAFAEIIIYLQYKNHAKFNFKLDWKIIVHHIVALLPLLLQIPKPVYYWFVISLFPLMEISTIFLNVQQMGKYFKFSKMVRKYSKLAFISTWFIVRVPIFVVIWWRIIYYFKKYFALSFARGIALFGGFTVLTILNTSWTATIIKKVINYFNNTETAKYIHASVVQLGSSIATQRKF